MIYNYMHIYILHRDLDSSAVLCLVVHMTFMKFIITCVCGGLDAKGVFLSYLT